MEENKLIHERNNNKNQESLLNKEHILWRVSSTLFSHLRADVDITPLEEMSKHYWEEKKEI